MDHTMTLSAKQIFMYKLEDGLGFERLKNGDIKITKRENSDPSSEVTFERIIEADVWISIVAILAGDINCYKTVKNLHYYQFPL